MQLKNAPSKNVEEVRTTQERKGSRDDVPANRKGSLLTQANRQRKANIMRSPAPSNPLLEQELSARLRAFYDKTP